jgi:hypothetical protein
LADQVVAVPSDDDRLCPRLLKGAARRVAKARRVAGTTEQAAEAENAQRPMTMPYRNKVPVEPVTW